MCAGVPGVGVAWGQGDAAAAARAGRPGRERRPRPVRVRMVHINLRVILQLGVMGIILYQARLSAALLASLGIGMPSGSAAGPFIERLYADHHPKVQTF